MFGWFKSKKSDLRRRLETLLFVQRTWFEWSLTDGRWVPTLIVEVGYDLNPDLPDFYQAGLDDIARVVSESLVAPPHVRVIERKYDA